MGVVGGAVERVDDPAIARIARARAAFLAEDAVRGKGAEDDVAHLALALQVDVGDEIDHAFVAHLTNGVRAAAEHLTRGAGSLERDVARPSEIAIADERRTRAHSAAR